MRQYSDGHNFLQAKKADKGAFAFAENAEDGQQQPDSPEPPMIAKTRSQARFLPVKLAASPSKKKKGAPQPATPDKSKLSVKPPPPAYQSGWWITPWTPTLQKTGSFLDRITPKKKKRHSSESIEV